jgi:hypothetical protein
MAFKLTRETRHIKITENGDLFLTAVYVYEIYKLDR